MSDSDLPSQARIVVVGGGIVGCSLAYHLTKLGEQDVVLIEQGRLSGGTTWHAAGLVGQLRSHANLTALIRYSAELYAGLEAETGLATGWKPCGSLNVARTAERMTALRRSASAARAQGVAIELIGPAEAARLWPLMRSDDLVGAAWLPGDGKANPTDVTQALAKGARNRGARIFEKTRVTGIRLERGAVSGIDTSRGSISCEMLCLCAGQWSRTLAAKAGVTVPLHSAEHMYIVTEAIEGVTPDLPVMRDADGRIYFKEEVGGLVMGGFEPEAKPWGMDGIPDDFEFQLLPDDWEHFEVLMQPAIERVPALETARIKLFLNGPESFTPDNAFILGEAPEVRRLFIGAGFNSAGIASAGGAGRALAEWVLAGEPTSDLWPVDIRRFARFQGNPVWLRQRVTEVLGLHYAMPWPNREVEAARPLRCSPLHERLAAKGAVFGSKLGWERPNWFAPAGMAARTEYGFGRQNWFDAVAAEHRACREAAALFDASGMAKFLLEGEDAAAVLQQLCANDVDVPVETSVYTAMLNRRGGFESDLTVARLGRNRFLIVTGTGQATRDADWIGRNLPPGSRATLVDVTGTYAVLALAGPCARALLERLTRSSLDDQAFPFGAMREIDLGRARLWAMRRSYTGEAGFELYPGSEMAAYVYDALMEEGAALGLRDGGHYALDSLRIERGYRAWGRELSPDVTPWEAGLGGFVALDKGGFLGREAVLASRPQPLRQRLVCFHGPLPPEQMAWGGELVTADGHPVGEITSAAHAASLGGLAALGWVRSAGEAIDQAWLDQRSFAIDLAGEVAPVRASLRPFYLPGRKPARSAAVA